MVVSVLVGVPNPLNAGLLGSTTVAFASPFGFSGALTCGTPQLIVDDLISGAAVDGLQTVAVASWSIATLGFGTLTTNG